MFHSYLISRNQVKLATTAMADSWGIALGAQLLTCSFVLVNMQTTYENFRALYERQANPYNKGMMGNFREVFFSSIPPSRNKFRAKVRKEPDFPSRRVDGSFISPILGKATMDVEMGMKPAWMELGRESDKPIHELGDGDCVKEDSELSSSDEFGEQIKDTNIVEEFELEASPARGSECDSRPKRQPR